MQTGTNPAVDIGGSIGTGWRLLTTHWKTWVKMMLIMILPILPGMVLYWIGYASMMSSMMTMQQPNPYGGYGYAQPEVPMGGMVLTGIGGVVAWLGGFVTIYFRIGMVKAALKAARGGTPSLSDLKGNGHLYLRVLGASIVIGLCAVLGVLACFVGVFFVIGWYMFVVDLIVDKDLPIGEAMRQSKKITEGQMLMFLLLLFLAQFLSGLGWLACGVGLLFTAPLQILTLSAAYTRAVDGGASPAGGAAFPPAGAPGAWPPPATT